MPSQVAAPIPITPPRENRHQMTTPNELFADRLSATLAAKNRQFVTPVHTIQEHDYTVPAPPPPSPVSFRHEHWHPSASRR